MVSGEHTFSLLKQVRSYNCKTVRKDRLNDFATINIKCDLARKLHFSLIINIFSEKTLKTYVKYNIKLGLCLLINAFAQKRASESFVKYKFKLRLTFWCLI
jgi:hypothetical protein